MKNKSSGKCENFNNPESFRKNFLHPIYIYFNHSVHEISKRLEKVQTEVFRQPKNINTDVS